MDRSNFEKVYEKERQIFFGMLNGSIPLPRSIWHHMRARQIQLANQLHGRAPIYLDTRFWIDLQLAALGQERGKRALSLLAKLRQGVLQNKIFCPISSSTFIELLKHSNSSTRLDIARLVDELSLGVSLISAQELISFECDCFADGQYEYSPAGKPVPIWTKLSYALGTCVPNTNEIPKSALLALQVAVFDSLWKASLEDIAKEISIPSEVNRLKFAQQLTNDIRDHAHEVRDFDTVYRAEVIGVADLYARPLADAVRRKNFQSLAPADIPKSNEMSLCRNIVGNSIILGKSRKIFRSIHIPASLHSIIRLNKDRKFKPNDLMDIQHALNGVGYCSAFFSEGSLVTALTQKPLMLDKFYNCFVTSNMERSEEFY